MKHGPSIFFFFRKSFLVQFRRFFPGTLTSESDFQAFLVCKPWQQQRRLRLQAKARVLVKSRNLHDQLDCRKPFCHNQSCKSFELSLTSHREFPSAWGLVLTCLALGGFMLEGFALHSCFKKFMTPALTVAMQTCEQQSVKALCLWPCATKHKMPRMPELGQPRCPTQPCVGHGQDLWPYKAGHVWQPQIPHSSASQTNMSVAASPQQRDAVWGCATTLALRHARFPTLNIEGLVFKSYF